MARIATWRLVVGAVVTLSMLGCIGPCSLVVDDILEGDPADFNTCCAGAKEKRLAELAGVDAIPVAADAGTIKGPTSTVRIAAVATTRRLVPSVAEDVHWGLDWNGIYGPDDAHEYVLALVVRVGAAKSVDDDSVFAVSVYPDPSVAWTQCPPVRSPSPSASVPRSAPPSAAPASSAPACRGVTRYSARLLIKPGDGEPAKSAILVVRVPVGETVMFTALETVEPASGTASAPAAGSAGDRPAVDLRTGERTQYPRPPRR
jgi:hypothetical protein